MVMKMGLKLRSAEDNFNSHNMANIFLFSTWRDNTCPNVLKNFFKIVQFLKVNSKLCL